MILYKGKMVIFQMNSEQWCISWKVFDDFIVCYLHMNSHLSSSVPKGSVGTLQDWHPKIFFQEKKNLISIIIFPEDTFRTVRYWFCFCVLPHPKHMQKKYLAPVWKPDKNDIKVTLFFPFPYVYFVRIYDKFLSVSLNKISEVVSKSFWKYIGH